jgi:putative transcription factor
LALTCEVCGSQIKTAPSTVEIDGAILRVCQSCSKRGRPVSVQPRIQRGPPMHMAPMAPRREVEPELEVDPEYTQIVRQAREKLGLTQEALGMKINVKPSVISHVETGKMKPDIILARTLMHFLKVNLLVPASDLESETK